MLILNFFSFCPKLVNYLINHVFMRNSSQLKKHCNAFAISKVVAIILKNTFYINKIIPIFRGTFECNHATMGDLRIYHGIGPADFMKQFFILLYKIRRTTKIRRIFKFRRIYEVKIKNCFIKSAGQKPWYIYTNVSMRL
jgi:hypothetical protein